MKKSQIISQFAVNEYPFFSPDATIAQQTFAKEIQNLLATQDPRSMETLQKSLVSIAPFKKSTSVDWGVVEQSPLHNPDMMAKLLKLPREGSKTSTSSSNRGDNLLAALSKKIGPNSSSSDNSKVQEDVSDAKELFPTYKDLILKSKHIDSSDLLWRNDGKNFKGMGKRFMGPKDSLIVNHFFIRPEIYTEKQSKRKNKKRSKRIGSLFDSRESDSTNIPQPSEMTINFEV